MDRWMAWQQGQRGDSIGLWRGREGFDKIVVSEKGSVRLGHGERGEEEAKQGAGLVCGDQR